VAGAGRPSPKQRPGRATVYRSRARDSHSDARAWIPFPEADSLQTLGDLLDTDVAPAALVTPPERERTLAPKRVHTRRARRQHRRRRQRRRIAFAALALLTVAAVAQHLPQLRRHSSQVMIRVDGEKRVSAQSDAKSVAGVLREHDVKVDAGDRVRPRPNAKLTDGMTVDVIRPFEVDVDLDGVVTPVRTTWAKPARVLEQLQLDPGKVSIVTAPRRLSEGSSLAIRSTSGASWSGRRTATEMVSRCTSSPR
jgi:hypothetical protein